MRRWRSATLMLGVTTTTTAFLLLASPRPAATVLHPQRPVEVTAFRLLGATSAREARPTVRPARPVATRDASSRRRPSPAAATPPTRRWTPPAPPAYHGFIPLLIHEVFGAAAPMALCVANAESGLNPRAYNASGAAGLFQLMPLWYRGHWHFDPFDPVANVHYAHLMFLAYGWGPWRGDPCVGG